MTQMTGVMIELEGITKRYGEAIAVDDVSLRIHSGELVTLLGPSGCGKTTLLRCITGHVRPEAGTVRIGGKDVTGVPPSRRNLGMVFQNFALFPHLTALQNVEFPLEARGIPREERVRLAGEALEMVRLKDLASRYPRQLSGGQQQRVGLARALVYRPAVLLLDEPLSNLDAKLREEMRLEIRDLLRRMEITALYVTHDQEEAFALSDRVAVIHRGRLEQVATPEEIFEYPRTQFVADFVGVSNFLEGRVVRHVDGYAVMDCGEVQLTAVLPPDTEVGERVIVSIRPYEIEIMSQPPDGGLDANVFQGGIRGRTYFGNWTEYRVALGSNTALRIHTPPQIRMNPGDTVMVRLPADRCRAVLAGSPSKP